jgi:hypothetical protein
MARETTTREETRVSAARGVGADSIVLAHRDRRSLWSLRWNLALASAGSLERAVERMLISCADEGGGGGFDD